MKKILSIAIATTIIVYTSHLYAKPSLGVIPLKSPTPVVKPIKKLISLKIGNHEVGAGVLIPSTKFLLSPDGKK